jgi:hypothetical protein
VIFFRSLAAVDPDPACPECGARGMAKLVSRVSMPRGDDARLDELAYGGSFGDLDESDPRSVERWARTVGGRLGNEAGMDLEGLADEVASGGLGGGPGAVEDWTPGGS